MPNSMVGYKIKGDFDNEMFEITIRHFDALLEVKKSLDYETTKFYRFILQFSDRNDILLPESWNVVLVIEDFNDNKPVINKESLSASVYRNASEGTKFHTITGSDADSDLNFYNKLRFYKKPNSENPVGSRFSVSENGDVTVKSSLLNEMNDEITFQVFVRDMNGSVDGLESDFANMSVTILGEKSKANPKPSEIKTLVINENTNPGELIEIGTMPNSMVDYKINGDFDNELFGITIKMTIRHFDALLEVKKSLDYETTKFYSFILQFSDRNDILLPESWNVVLVIEDFNDNKPVINKESLSASVYRNASEGTKFHTITGSDADSDLNFYNKLRFYKKPNSENPVGP